LERAQLVGKLRNRDAHEGEYSAAWPEWQAAGPGEKPGLEQPALGTPPSGRIPRLATNVKSVTKLVRTDSLGYKSYRVDSVQPFAAASGPKAGTAF